MTTKLSCSIPLPVTFRPRDILDFHRRDPLEMSERVTDCTLQKGIVWKDRPASLSIAFQNDQVEAELVIEEKACNHSQSDFQAMIHRMLGLDQEIDAFERRYCDHPQLGALIARQQGLRVPVSATPFEALTWAVTGQQISVGAAVSLRRKLITAAGVCHSNGLVCYPDAHRISGLNEDILRQAGFSMAKARTLLTVSKLVSDNSLPLETWTRTIPVSEIQERLEAVRGIGPWTISYTLLRGFGWLDGSLHGDAAVRRGLQTALKSPATMSEEQVKSWLAEFSPWRALVAAHLWAV